ncbi:MAG: hypothetical protein ACPGQI_01370 [Gammaproteobacteria bacterium]
MTTTDYDDERQVARATTKQKKRRQIELEDFRSVLETPAGRRFISRLLDQTGLLAADMFTGNSTTFYNLGKRDTGLWIYNEIMSAAPAMMIRMMSEKLELMEKGPGK